MRGHRSDSVEAPEARTREDPQAPLSLFAIAAPGLEELLAAELAEIGIAGSVEPGGVAWAGGVAELYRANLHSRTASRVLVRLGEFSAKTFFELERRAARLPWESYLFPGRRTHWRVTCRKSRLYHQGAVEQRFREAVERVTGPVQREGPIDEEAEGADEQVIVVRFLHDRCTVSMDSSGELLHRRGYRQATGKAPLRETLAAAVLLASGWDRQTPLLDPLCGSGTLLIEGALMARNIPPGLASSAQTPRKYAFQEWPTFDSHSWQQIVGEARAQVRDAVAAPIVGSDRDAGAIEAAKSNGARAGVAADIALSVRSLSAAEVPTGTGWLVTNPPYGIRVGEADRVRNLYAALGGFARRCLTGWTLALLSADPGLERQLGIPLREALRTKNGGIPVRVVVGKV